MNTQDVCKIKKNMAERYQFNCFTAVPVPKSAKEKAVALMFNDFVIQGWHKIQPCCE